MKRKGNLSLLEEVLTINIIRRKILQYIPSFYDISNLTKSSRYIDYLIHNEVLIRDMLQYSDKQNIIITNKDGVFENKKKQKLRNIKFLVDEKFYQKLNHSKHFFGEVFINNNVIKIDIQNEIQKCRRKDKILFVKKFVEEMRLNSHVRRSATILHLSGNFFTNNCYIFRTLSYMNHDNITTIQFPIHYFMGTFKKFKKFRNDIFKGFPKLNKLIFYNNSTIHDYKNILKNKNIIKNVLKSFSRKKNPILIVECNENSYRILEYVLMIIQIGNKYRIKIKSNSQILFSLFRRMDSEICSFMKCVHFPIGEITHYFHYQFTNPVEFFDIMLNLKCFKNLEELKLKFTYNGIKDNFDKMCKYKSWNLSFGHCKNLHTIKLDFSEYYNETNFDTELLSQDLEYLISLMPSTVKKVELNHVKNLSRKTIQLMNKYMPNIKILIMNNGSYKDCDCLQSFQNLQALISNNNHAIILPRSLKFLAIKKNTLYNDQNNIHIHEELIQIYCDIFTKCLQNNKEYYIFFDDIKYWDIYKRVIQKYFC